METQGYCAKGDNCTFAHSAEELLADGGNGGISAQLRSGFSEWRSFPVPSWRSLFSMLRGQKKYAGPGRAQFQGSPLQCAAEGERERERERERESEKRSWP